MKVAHHRRYRLLAAELFVPDPNLATSFNKFYKARPFKTWHSFAMSASIWQMIAPERLARCNAAAACCVVVIMTIPHGIAAPVPRVTKALDTHLSIFYVEDVSPGLDSDVEDARPSRDFDNAQDLLLSEGSRAPEQAVALFRSAAEQGHPLAEYDLGYCYEAGIGVPADTAQALAWYRRAAADTKSDRLRSVATSSIRNLIAQSSAMANEPAPLPIAPSVDPAAAMNAPAPLLPLPAPSSPLSSNLLPPDVVASLIGRGNQMLRAGDINAARLFFTRAASAGSSEAAMSVGETYDQRFLEQIGAKGLVANPAEAASWYRRAAALGNHEANLLLAGFDDKPAPAR